MIRYALTKPYTGGRVFDLTLGEVEARIMFLDVQTAHKIHLQFGVVGHCRVDLEQVTSVAGHIMSFGLEGLDGITPVALHRVVVVGQIMRIEYGLFG